MAAIADARTGAPDFGGGATTGYGVSYAFDDSRTCEEVLRWSLQHTAKAREVIMEEPSFWVFVSLYAPAGLVGVLGNALTIYIFAAKVKRTPTSTFVIALAIVDLCVCLVVIPSRFLSILLINFGFDIVCKGSEFVFFVALPTSGLLLVAIAVDRFVMICLARSDLITPRAIKIALAVVVLAGIVIGLPSAFTVSVYQDAGNVYMNSTRPCFSGLCKPTYVHIGPTGAWLYWMVVAALYMVMAVVLTAMYLMIFLRVLKAKKKVGKWTVAKRSSANGSRALAPESAAEDSYCPQHLSAAAVASRGESRGRGSAPPAKSRKVADVEETDVASPAITLLKVPKEGSSFCKGANDSSLSNAPSAAEEATVAGVAKRARKKRLPHVNTAVTLCLVTGTFIVAYLPVIVIPLSGLCTDSDEDSVSSGKCESHNLVGVLWHFFLFNHVVNPIIYAFMNPRFKEALCAMVSRRRGRPRFFMDTQSSDVPRKSVDWQSSVAH